MPGTWAPRDAMIARARVEKCDIDRAPPHRDATMRDGKRERARDGAQRGRQKKAKWFKSSHASGGTIPYGARGVIVTCDGGKERSAARDVARNLGEQHERARKRAREESEGADGASDAATGAATAETKAEDAGDAGDALAAELEELREAGKNPLFKEISLDMRACTFVRASKEVVDVADVAALVKADLERARDTNVTFSRHAMRVVPVETTCFAGVDEIKEACKPLIEKHFKSGREQTFAIAFERRSNNTLHRTEVIEAIAGMIEQPPNKVNLGDPDLTIMVEIVKGVACLSVVQDYEKLCKYNLRMVAMTKEDREHAKATANGNAPAPGTKKNDEEKPAEAAD